MREITRRDLVRGGMGLSTATVVNGSAIARAATLLSASSAVSPAVTPTALPPREQLLFDFGWKFAFGDGADPLRDFGFGNGDRKSTRLNSSHLARSRMPSSA